MTHIRYTAPKTSHHFLLSVTLRIDGKGRCRLEKTEAPAMPARLDCDDGQWSAAHLLLGAVATGWAEVLLAFAERSHMDVQGSTCSVIGQLQPVEGAYRFTSIDVYPELRIPVSADIANATSLLKKAEAANTVASTLDTALYYHSRLLNA